MQKSAFPQRNSLGENQKNEDSNKIQDILDILLKRGWIIKAQADDIREKSRVMKKPIAEILEENKIINQDKLLEAYKEFFNLPIIRLKNIYIPPQVISMIPEEMAKKYHILAFSQKGSHLKVAIARPYRLQAEKPGILSDIVVSCFLGCIFDNLI